MLLGLSRRTRFSGRPTTVALLFGGTGRSPQIARINATPPHRMNDNALRIGLFGIGLDTYWPQFKGLEARLQGYLGRVATNL